MHRLLIIGLMGAAMAEDKPSPTIEELQSKVKKLEAQLVESEKRFQFEMAICAGALTGARQAAFAKPAEATVPRPARPAKPPQIDAAR